MRVLIYGINFAPELTGIGKYSGDMAAWLVAQGHEVRVVTAPPYYPAWQVSPGYSCAWYSREVIDGVVVRRCPLWVPGKVRGLSRILHLASFALSSLPAVLWRALVWRPDIVFVVEPAIFCAPGGWLAARIGGARAWLHIQDFEIDAAFDLGIVRSGGLRNIIFALERWLMRRFDTVSTISERMLERLADKGVGHSEQCFFPNWVDTGFIFPLDTPSPMRQELGIADTAMVLLYSGNMGEKQGLEIIADVALKLRDESDLIFILCGDGAIRGELETLTKGLKNIQFLPLQPVEKLNALMNMADIHLLPQRADVEDLVMPSKLTSMLASGRPIVATARASTEVARVVENCGLVVEPGDAVAFAEALLVLGRDQRRRLELGIKGRHYAVRHLGRDGILDRAFAE